jgi:hypothetical protein
MYAQEQNKNLRIGKIWSMWCETEALQYKYSDQHDIQKL